MTFSDRRKNHPKVASDEVRAEHNVLCTPKIITTKRRIPRNARPFTERAARGHACLKSESVVVRALSTGRQKKVANNVGFSSRLSERVLGNESPGTTVFRQGHNPDDNTIAKNRNFTEKNFYFFYETRATTKLISRTLFCASWFAAISDLDYN